MWWRIVAPPTGTALFYDNRDQRVCPSFRCCAAREKVREEGRERLQQGMHAEDGGAALAALAVLSSVVLY